MTTVDLTLLELGAVVGGAVLLAVTDAAALSRLGIAWLAKKLGVSPQLLSRYQSAAEEGEATDDPPPME